MHYRMRYLLEFDLKIRSGQVCQSFVQVQLFLECHKFEKNLPIFAITVTVELGDKELFGHPKIVSLSI